MLKTVHAKLLVPILLILILGSLISGIASHRAASNIVIDAFKEDGVRSAAKLREYIDMVISKAQLDLSALSVAPSVKHLLLGDEASEELVEGYIMALVDQHGIYNSITILNTNGIIVASTSGSTGGDRADREYFQDSMNGNLHISGVEVSRQTGRLTTFISIPVRDTEDNSIIGVALTVIRLEELNSRYVVPVNLLGDHGYAMIVTSDGTIVAHRDEEMIFAPVDEDEERGETDGMVMVYETALEQLLFINEIGGNSMFETSRDGKRFMAFAERSHYTDWFAVVICPVGEFYEASNYLAVFNVILALLLILAQVVIIWIIVRSITKALSTTIRYSEAVSKGSLNSSLSIEREDEIGTLAQSLRIMVGSLKDMIEVSDKKTAEAEAATAIIMDNIQYASKIQKNLLPSGSTFDSAFSNYSAVWKPKDVVGGDIFWLKNFEQGSVLCVCDCTGHGTSGALLTTLVVSALEAVVWPNNCYDTAHAVWQIDQRLASVLNVQIDSCNMEIKDGCDLAVLFVANDGSVTISAGHTDVFVCDGKTVTRYRGQRIFVGEGKLTSKDKVKTITIPANPNNTFYIASDGLYDQVGGKDGVPYGYDEFEKIILENHGEEQSVISDKIKEAFEAYRGENKRRDDLELITFKPKIIKEDSDNV
jgi:serine phosphatase RsbU (regulator of sigma subunit)/HAMP domain-containing protein